MQGETVAILLLKNKLEVPDNWKYEADYMIKYIVDGKIFYTTTAI